MGIYPATSPTSQTWPALTTTSTIWSPARPKTWDITTLSSKRQILEGIFSKNQQILWFFLLSKDKKSVQVEQNPNSIIQKDNITSTTSTTATTTSKNNSNIKNNNIIMENNMWPNVIFFQSYSCGKYDVQRRNHRGETSFEWRHAIRQTLDWNHHRQQLQVTILLIRSRFFILRFLQLMCSGWRETYN